MRILRAVLSGLALLAVAAAPAAAAPAHPTDRDQPLRDGCQRGSFFNITLVNTPEWVYVNHDPSVHVATGISRVPHPTPIDQPGTHDWFDFNANLVPDAPYRYLMAGSRSSGTANFAGDDADAGESFGRLHYEWEEGSYPKFAWPSDGDRVTIWGSWIWDCGHWTEGDKVTGERTEFHPLSAVAVTRHNPSQARPGERETDAYVSNDGTYAHATLECARNGTAQPDGTYGPGFFDCARDPKNIPQKLARSYRFKVPAPKRPSGAKRLLFRSVSRAHTGRTSEHVRVTSSGLVVTVKPKAGSKIRWGRSYFVRWAGAKPKATKLRVTLDRLLIRRADPDTTEDGVDPAGEHIALYLELNGYWQLVNNWAPSLFQAHDNMVVKLNRTIPVTVQRGQDVHLFMMGRECDGPSGVTLFGHFVPRTKPCPFNRTESKISEHNNDDPGTILDRYRSPAAALGTHTTKSRPTVRFPGTGPITFFDGKQGNDTYRLTYTVKRAK